jgi:hypothetical protein
MVDRRSPSVVATLTALPIALVAGLVAFWWLGGFRGAPAPAPSPAPSSPRPAASGPVTVEAPALAGPAATACRALVAKLPRVDGDLPRRPVTAGPGQNAAYGDPPVILTCGTATVPSLAPTDTITQLSGVCWFTEEGPDATVWTTVDRAVPVRVRVPRTYDPPGERVVVFSTPITDTLEPATARPSGC